jgi:nicotinate-nucleotide adenylyltransferase
LVKIAIFGGSFDPPHRGHQEIVKVAVEMLDIDKLIIVPAFLNPFKSSTLASPQQRLSWCHTIFDPIDGVEICDYEINAGRAVYSSETIRYLSIEYEVAYLIIGADNLDSIYRWNEFEWIDDRVIWVIAKRSNFNIDRDILTHSIILELDEDISSTAIRERRDLTMVDNRIKSEIKILLQRQDI